MQDTVSALTRPQSQPDEGWIEKGPFRVRETIVEKFGEPYSRLDVRLNYGPERWPEQTKYDVVRDKDGLPVMYWRQKDDYRDGTSLDGRSNGGVNWAPRGCFIWRSKISGYPLQFVHVNMDGKQADSSGRVVWAIFAVLAYWVLGLVLVGLQVMEPAAYLGWVGIGSYFPAWGALRWWRNFEERRVWSNNIALNAVQADWAALEGFEITDSHALGSSGPSWRLYVLASFGKAARSMRIIDGRVNGESAREYVRMLVVKFVDARSEHFYRLGLDQYGRSL